MAKNYSPKYSFKGWELWEWLKGNWKSIKEIVKVGAPLLLGLAFFKDNPALVVTITAIGKFVIDTVEFWMKSY